MTIDKRIEINYLNDVICFMCMKRRLDGSFYIIQKVSTFFSNFQDFAAFLLFFSDYENRIFGLS